MAYDLSKKNHFVLIVKSNDRYNEAQIKNALKFKALQKDLKFVEKFKLEQKKDNMTKVQYFAVFRDHTIRKDVEGYSRNIIDQ